MVKILHTADIHLREYKDARWEALEQLVEIGRENEVSIFAICGDLFDKDIDAENLRPKIREIFSNIPFKVLIIPGNHDADSYKGGMYFGEDVFILTGSPFEYSDVRIIGMPFEPIQGQNLLGKIRALKEALTPDKKNVLLCHGELLDVFFSGADFGAEGEERYMPFKLSYFEGLNINYVLAGHFHSRFDDRRLKNGGYFVYPGSPISITKRETGQRKVNILEVGKPPKEYLLNTPHFEELIIEFDPVKDKEPVEAVEKHLKNLHPKAMIILTLKGFVNGKAVGMNEIELRNQLYGLVKNKCDERDFHYEIRDIQTILEDDLFKTFMDKLEQTDYEEEKKKQMRDIAIKAMTEARA